MHCQTRLETLSLSFEWILFTKIKQEVKFGQLQETQLAQKSGEIFH